MTEVLFCGGCSCAKISFLRHGAAPCLCHRLSRLPVIPRSKSNLVVWLVWPNGSGPNVIGNSTLRIGGSLLLRGLGLRMAAGGSARTAVQLHPEHEYPLAHIRHHSRPTQPSVIPQPAAGAYACLALGRGGNRSALGRGGCFTEIADPNPMVCVWQVVGWCR